jgi:hypothetical protein
VAWVNIPAPNADGTQTESNMHANSNGRGDGVLRRAHITRTGPGQKKESMQILEGEGWSPSQGAYHADQTQTESTSHSNSG